LPLPLPYPHVKDHEVQANFESLSGAITRRYPTAFSYLANAANHTSSGSVQATPLDTNLFDTGALWDSSNGRFAIVTPGIYLVCGQVAFASNVTGIRGTFILRNGSAWLQGLRTAGATDQVAAPISAHYEFAAGDTVALAGYQNSGGNLGYLTGTAPYFTWLSISWVSTL